MAELPKTPDWPWHRVLYELYERGHSLASLGRRFACAPSNFANVRRQARPGRQAQIASAIGLSPLAIWPSRYEPSTGRPLTHREWKCAEAPETAPETAPDAAPASQPASQGTPE